MIVACIPAYNEEETIGKVLIEAGKYVDRILVCDDGSSDMTAEIAERMGVSVMRHHQNLGKGAALRTLFNSCKPLNPDTVVTLDADWQHDPREIPRLVKPILDGEADIVVGSRFLGKTNMPGYRALGNKLLNVLTHTAAGMKVSDTQSGFRAYSPRALQEIELATDTIAVDSQILIDAAQKGLRLLEVPVTARYEGETSTYGPVSHGYTVASYILRRIVLAHPFLVVGLPGLFTLGVSINLFYTTFNVFYGPEHIFSIPHALAAITTLVLGALFLMASVILYALSLILGKDRGR